MGGLRNIGTLRKIGREVAKAFFLYSKDRSNRLRVQSGFRQLDLQTRCDPGEGRKGGEEVRRDST